jgi:hypothetical protein
VHRDPHELRPHHLVAREGGVEDGRIEAGQPVPQREVGGAAGCAAGTPTARATASVALAGARSSRN